MLREAVDINTESTGGIIIKQRFGPISKLCILLTLALDAHLVPLPGTCQTTIRLSITIVFISVNFLGMYSYYFEPGVCDDVYLNQNPKIQYLDF